ncbi:hypothetical protein [Streptomyces sp. NRRL WC-3742]|uniref:hypothetical protein n=1 Tax=Streptomyces sp. NRRL WC-3742 TaxID=1463934 RepID=UPI0004C60900|nr:hypothetical protein [Streptomyces sp. NRRL WC-3742]
MNLEGLQVGLLTLLKSREQEPQNDHPYFRHLDASGRLSVLREISAWWRSFSIEETCVLTSTLLKKRGTFAEVAGRFADRPDATPYHQQQAAVFLAAMGRHGDPLLAAVAEFEGALLAIRTGDATGPVTIHWQHAPYAVLESLLLGAPLDEARIRGAHRMVVSPDLPGLFRVEPLP